jgi:uncharacterized membrane protein
MNVEEDDAAIERLEMHLGWLLRSGVLLATACLAAGLVLTLKSGDTGTAHLLLTAGLVVLMLTPLARVVASFLAYVRLRDWFFASTTAMVIVVLVAAWLLKP